jgi:hypothetical protein
MKRILLAGILGGVTVFVWTFVAHEFLGLGEVGVKEIPNEAAVMMAMQVAIPDSGLYIYPGPGIGPKPTREQMNAAMPAFMKKYEKSGHGILVYHVPSGRFNFGVLLGREFGLNVLQALLAAWLLSCAASGRTYAKRVTFVAVAGILAAISTNVEYWNWYDFPGNYVAAYMTTQVSAFILAGLVIGGLVKNGTPARS